jgi:hypothetical protein
LLTLKVMLGAFYLLRGVLAEPVCAERIASNGVPEWD